MKSVWKEYTAAHSSSSDMREASYRSFCRYWKRYLPHIIISTDLCWKCQQNTNAISQAMNSSDGDKEDVSITTLH